MRSNGIPAAGSKLNMSSSGNVGTFVPVAQLQKIAPEGSKQTIVDQTNLLTPDVGDRPLPVRVVSGEIDIAGVLDPQNTSILQLGVAHANLGIYYFEMVLSDGTLYTFQGCVAEYVPFDLDVKKAVGFTAKIRVSGLLTGPAGVA